ncbi:MAG: hypothetical protein WCS27_09190 [Victivallaceae bacterium]
MKKLINTKKDFILTESLIKDSVNILARGQVRLAAPFMPEYKLASMYRKVGWDAVVLNFFKHGTQEMPAEKGISFLWRDADTLYVCGFFEDSDVFNTATKRNEKTWQTGDVMEFFFQAPGQKEYYELHVTPSSATLELRIPGIENLGKIPFESQLYYSGFFSCAERFDYPECKGWIGLMAISFKGLGIMDGKLDKARFSVCRYNYNKKWDVPEKSSTTIYLEGGFHQPHLWHEIVKL